MQSGTRILCLSTLYLFHNKRNNFRNGQLVNLIILEICHCLMKKNPYFTKEKKTITYFYPNQPFNFFFQDKVTCVNMSIHMCMETRGQCWVFLFAFLLKFLDRISLILLGCLTSKPQRFCCLCLPGACLVAGAGCLGCWGWERAFYCLNCLLQHSIAQTSEL